MRKRLFLLLSVVLVACFASFYVCEARADTEINFQTGKIRIVTVKVVADEEFREFYGPRYNWKDVASNIVENASKVFEKDFGIRFVVKEFEAWNPGDYTKGFVGIEGLAFLMDLLGVYMDDAAKDEIDAYMDLNVFMVRLRKEISLDRCDMVVAFSGQRIVEHGAVDKSKRYVIVEDTLASCNRGGSGVEPPQSVLARIYRMYIK